MEVSYEDYLKIKAKADQFNLENGRLPRYVDLNGYKYLQADYGDAYHRVEQFKKDIGRNPEVVEIKGSPIIQKGKNWLLLEKQIGSFSNLKELDGRLRAKGKYWYYYNGKFNNEQTYVHITTTGVNCTDYCEALKEVLEEMGYTVKIEHVRVKCNDGKWYGHYLLRVNGREYKFDKNDPSTWIKFDAVSSTKTGRPLGQACCVAGFQHVGWGIVL